MDLMSQPSLPAKGQRVLTKLHEGLTTGKMWMTKLKLTRPTAAGCLASFHQLTSTDWNLVSSLIVYAAKGPCAEPLYLSVWMSLSGVFQIWTSYFLLISALLAPPFEFKQAAVASWTRYEEGLWRERPTPINTCVWRKLAVGKLVKSAHRCQGCDIVMYCQHEVKIVPFTILSKNMVLLLLWRIVSQKNKSFT